VSCLSVCPLVCIELLSSYLTDFQEIWYLGIFRKFVEKNWSFIKNGQEYQVFYMKTNVHFWSYLAEFFLEWEMFQTNVVEKMKTHFMLSIPPSPPPSKILPFVRYCGRILNRRTGYRLQHGTCALHTGYLRLQVHTQNIAVPLHRRLNEPASLVRYTYVACLLTSVPGVPSTVLWLPMVFLCPWR